ncbi:hypothetical protein Poly30_05910 [Planctomycetes bacterium Poly30]|uniref:Nickel uptake substrate-specific transmembrane region n=1 Tax=Saltatorellus ferox TaxID=2528018 RepID=A0A518ELY0_9BACT|nr:hypothetical protein Poly30_05910 [Planctomycetes bacterium Poly30]
MPLLVLAALCLVGAAWFALRDPASAATGGVTLGAEPMGEPDAEARSPGGEEIGALSSSQQDERIALEELRPETELAPSADAQGLSAQGTSSEEAPVALAGRIVLYENGVPLETALNGTAHLRAWSANRGQALRAPLIDSRFEVRMRQVDGGVELIAGGEVVLGLTNQVERFTVEVPDVDGLGGLLLHDPADAENVVRSVTFAPGTLDATVPVRGSAAVSLEVVAEGSGAHLADVDVLFANSALVVATYPRGQYTAKLAEAERSPVLLQPSGDAAQAQAATLLVGARGYAWKKVSVDLTTVGERRVELSPAGSLELACEGLLPKDARLRLRTSNGLFADMQLRAESTTLAGLPPGSYRVGLEVGDWFSQPAVLAEQEIEIVAGESTDVRLVLEARAAAIVAPLSGTLIVPAAWEIPQNSVTLRRMTPSVTGARATSSFKGKRLSEVPGEDGHFAFANPELEVGTYVITHFQLNWAQVFEHPPEGTLDYRLEVPPPIEVTVRVVQEGTNETPEGIERVIWCPVRPEGVEFGSMATAGKDAATGLFHLRVPEGKFTASARQAGFASEDVVLDTASGSEFTLSVRPLAVCHVELRSEGKLVPWPDTYSLTAIDPTGKATKVDLAMSGAERWFRVETPGVYRVQGPEVDGFLEPAPVSADLVLGEDRTLVIELTAK